MIILHLLVWVCVREDERRERKRERESERESERDIRIKLIKTKGKGSGEIFVMKYEDCGEREGERERGTW